MHCRFEINFLVDRIVGRRPPVRILEIGWQDKRQHIRRFLLDYYARRRRLPLGRHDLGLTAEHHLTVGVINFSAVRRELRDKIERRHRGRDIRILSFIRQLLGNREESVDSNSTVCELVTESHHPGLGANGR